MDNRNLKIISVFLFAIFLTNTVFALGINSPYWKTNPLKMYPGETKDISFTLVNSVDEKTPANAFVSLIEENEIAQITTGDQYTIIPGGKETLVLKISVPESAKIGDSYNIKFSVKSAPKEETGNVQLNIGYNIDFPVIITEKSSVQEAQDQTLPEQKTNFNTIILSIITLIVIIIGIFFILKKKN